MAQIMLAERSISLIHHEGRNYHPNPAGEFEIEDRHVTAMRKHGLRLKEQVEAAEAAARLNASLISSAAARAESAKIMADCTKKIEALTTPHHLPIGEKAA